MDDRGPQADRTGQGSVAPAVREHAGSPAVGSRPAARIGGAAAVLAAPIFLGAVATGGWRQPGFDQWSSFVSELGADGSPAASATNVAFALVGLCLVVFAVGFLVALPRLREIGALLVVPGVAFVVLAVSPCSTGCPIALVDPGATAADAVHNVAATAGLLALSLAGMLMADRAPDGFGPRWYRGFSGAAGATVGLAGALFGLSVLVHWPAGIAVFERLMLVAAMAWNTITGWALLRSGAPGRPAQYE